MSKWTDLETEIAGIRKASANVGGTNDVASYVYNRASAYAGADHEKTTVALIAAAITARQQESEGMQQCGWCKTTFAIGQFHTCQKPAESEGVVESMRAFTNDVLDMMREGHDVDGGYLQDVAEKHGILIQVEVTEPCDPEYCLCAEVDEFPTMCYRSAPWLTRIPDCEDK